MSNKTTKLISLASLSLLAISVGAPLVHAADVADYTSKGTITYTPSTDPTDPVDPQDPTKPVKPITPGDDPTNPTLPVTPGTNGPLSIDFASSFDFGQQEITSSDATYYAADQVVVDNGTVLHRTNYVQVTDNRGTFVGWSLSVKATNFTTSNSTATANGAGTLTGAQITLGDAAIESASANPADKSAASTTLTPDVASGTILGATAGHGVGTNLLDFGGVDGATKGTAVSLFVPGETAKAQATYTSDLTWTLSDTPAN